MINLKFVFRSVKGHCYSNQFFVGFIHRTDFRHPVASGAAGRANVGLCPASSFFVTYELYMTLTFELGLDSAKINRGCQPNI